MARERRSFRKIGLTSPRILVPAVAGLVAVAVLMVLGVLRVNPTSPSEAIPYRLFEDDVRAGRVKSVEMYREDLHAAYENGRQVAVRDVSPEYTLGLLRKTAVSYDGLPPSGEGPVGVGVLVAVLLPYFFLGWLTVMMVRAAGSAADVDLEALVEGAGPTCPECDKGAPRDSRFCPHCAHPLQWTGQARQCPSCGDQVWRSDRHCRNCGRALASAEAKRSREGPAAPQAARGIPPAEPRTPPAEPRTPPAEPRTPPAEPRTPPAEPRTPPAEPRGAGAFSIEVRGVEKPARRERPSRPPTPGPLPGEKEAR